MAKLTRQTAKIFGENATPNPTNNDPEIGQFGSAKAGYYTGTGDIATIQGLDNGSHWAKGWVDAVTPNQQFPALPEMTGVHKVLSYQNAYVLQEGIPEYDASTTYYQNSICKGINAGGFLTLYKSLTNDNTGNALTNTTYWKAIPIEASGYANTELSNLTTEGNDRLHALKGYEDAGELLTDAEGLADVTKYAHSTFDESKFTKQNDPTITNDGILSGSTTTNYLKITGINLSTANSWKLCFPFPKGTITNSWQSLISAGGQSLQTAYDNSNGKVLFNISSNGSSWDIANGESLNPTGYDATKEQIVVLEYTGSAYSAKLIQEGTTIGTLPIAGLSKIYTTNTFYIGGNRSASSFTADAIDLKQLSITVDGVPVFSGNQTGIDTIKPDDYTPMPTNNPVAIPTNDIVTFGNNQYLSTDCEIDGTKDWEIHFDYVLTSSPVPTVFDCKLGDNYLQIGAGYNNGVILLVGNSSHTSWALTSGWQANKLQLGLNKLIFGYKASTQYYYVLANGNDAYHATSSATVPTGFKLRIGNNSGGTSPAKNLDLDSIKVYQEGDLVYQPCLKIPYTLSKTGSKIVDYIYRDRVSDMYEQFGYAPYYTLNEGVNFTIPQGELYGMLGNNGWNFIPPTNQLVADLEIASTDVPYTGTVSFASLLPNDGFYYECLFNYYIISYHSSNQNTNLLISDTSENITYIQDQIDSGSSDIKATGGEFKAILKSTSNLTINVTDKGLYEGSYLKFLAYKKVTV